MKRQLFTTVAAAALVIGTAGSAAAVPERDNGKNADADGNGYPDAGVVVTGTFPSLYAYDANGGVYWDQGFGRIAGTVDSLEDLDQETLTTCDYNVIYRGSFENNAYQDTGWIRNNIRCSGAEPGTYNSVIVHESDPRYTGEGTSVWGTWEYHVDTWSGVGNVEKVERPISD